MRTACFCGTVHDGIACPNCGELSLPSKPKPQRPGCGRCWEGYLQPNGRCPHCGRQVD